MEIYGTSYSKGWKRLSMALLWVLLVYELFGTNIFLVQDANSASDLTESSGLNQIVFGGLFVGSLLVLLYQIRPVINFIKREKYLFIYLIWCLLSVLWSDFKMVSLKRYVQLIASYNVILAAFMFVRSDEDILRKLGWILVVFVILSFFCVMFVPGAIHDFGAWRGFRTHKTQLGMISLISSSIWAFSIRKRPAPVQCFSVFMLCLSVVLMVKSESMNSILCFVIFWVTIFVLSIDRHLRRFPTSYPLLPISVLLVVMALAAGYYYNQENLAQFMGSIGKDVTFTGRTYLWQRIGQISKEHALLGAGYGGFWVLENPKLIDMYPAFVWLPQQSHCGYLDIFNEEGLVGIALFALMLVKLFQRIFKQQRYNIWACLISVILMWNLIESTFFRLRSVMGTFFFLSYVMLFTEIQTKGPAYEEDIRQGVGI